MLIHTNECTVMGVCFSGIVVDTHTHTHIHKALLSIQFVFHYVSGSVLLFQSGSCCTTISLSAFKTMGRTLSLLFILCVQFYYNSLEIKLCSLFPFPLRGLTFKCIHADQSPRPGYTNVSFLAICGEITCTTILEKENEIHNETVIQSQISQGLSFYFNPFNLVLRLKTN